MSKPIGHWWIRWWLVWFVVFGCAPAAPMFGAHVAAEETACAPAVADVVALQLLLDTGCVQVLQDTTVITPAKRGFMVLTVRNELRGVPGAHLNFGGDAATGDWRGMQLAGSTFYVHDLFIDGSTVANVTEQSPMMRITGPNAGGRVVNVACTSTTAGDCLQVVGSPPDSLVSGVMVSNNRFMAARGAITVHGGLADSTITGNYLQARSGQAIDMEGTGGSARVQIVGNTVGLDPAAASALGMQIIGDAINIQSNTFIGQGVQLLPCTGCTMSGNFITQSYPRPGEGAIDILKGSSVQIHDEHIFVTPGAGACAAIRAMPRSGSVPSSVIIRDTAIETAANVAISEMGVPTFAMQGGSVTYTGAMTTALAMYLAGNNNPLSRSSASVDHVSFRGWSTIIHTTSSYGGMGLVQVTNNTWPGAKAPLVCDSPRSGALILGPVTYSGNDAPVATCGGLATP